MSTVPFAAALGDVALLIPFYIHLRLPPYGLSQMLQLGNESLVKYHSISQWLHENF